MSEDNKQKLLEALKKLEEYETYVNQEIELLEKVRDSYKDSNEEILNEDPEDYENEEIDRIRETIASRKKTIVNIKELLKIFDHQQIQIDAAKGFNYSINDPAEFSKIASIIYAGAEVISGTYLELQNLSKVSAVPLKFSAKDLDKIDKARKNIMMAMITIEARNPFAKKDMTLEDKIKAIKETKQNLPPIESFYKIARPFIEKVEVYCENCIDEMNEAIKDIQNEMHDLRIKEVNGNLAKFEESINARKESLETSKEVKELYEEYKTTNDKDILLKLVNQLTDLLILSQRDFKLIIHELNKADKEEEVIKEVKAEVIEEPKVLTEVITKELVDPDYYKKSDSQNIICFLGEEGDDIFTDLNDHFDNSNRTYVLSELVGLFNVLYKNRDYTAKTGGNPKYFSSSKVRAYLTRLGFNYLRFGVSKAQYRIHAIYKDSELLKKLGYGTGRVVFFGALGVNDDNEKTGAYERIARRGIQNTGNTVKLQPNFDYINHIMDGYVPASFLSMADKQKGFMGDFTGVIKGTKIKKAIENLKYINYDILDNETKANVKEFLDSYFEKQSEEMFATINEYKTRKRNSLD